MLPCCKLKTHAIITNHSVRKVMLTCWTITLTEGIAHISLDADTDGNMVPHITVGIDATQAGTRVLALPGDAGPVLGTVSIHIAFGSAVGRRSNHFRQAGALASVSNSSGRIGVGSTGIWNTRVYLFHNRFNS